MRSGTIAFATGVLAAQAFAALPDQRWFWCIPVLLIAAWLMPWLRLPSMFAVGLLWAFVRAALILNDALPTELEGETITVEGKVIDLPERAGDRLRFQFDTARITRGDSEWPGCGRVRVDWRGKRTADIHAGERWRLQVRLKRPHGFQNPGGFDYEGWLYQQRIRATGYVVEAGRHERLGPAGFSVDAVREHLRAKLRAAIGEHPLAGVVTALAIGARDGIDAEQWEVFFRTNTGHLIAISGLHIGLVAAFAYCLGRWLWSLSAYCVLRIAAPRVGALFGVAGAALYCGLAGFEVPAQRTLIMITVVMAALWLNRRVQPIDTLLIALALVLLLDPNAVLAVGFWLSFVAVAILLYSTVRESRGQRWWRLAGRAHLAMAVGLAPLLAWLFGQHPVLGPLANLVAVPWVSFVVVPLVLAGTLLLSPFPFAGYWLLRGALLALDILWMPIEKLAEIEWATVNLAHPGGFAITSAAFGAAILLMPRGMPCRWLGLIWAAPLFVAAPQQPARGDFWFTVLDVGQGLAAVVRTHTHTLVFDAGPVYSERFDTGSAVVIPYLRWGGVDRIDTLIVSHGDNDHIGGVRALLAHMPIGQVLSSVPRKVEHAQSAACEAGQSWEWDGVRFEMLSPPAAAASSENNASCVLRVHARGGTVLLTGDIEAEAEQRLVRQHSARLPADIVIAPHHGSNTSSTAPFVRAVAPHHVIYPMGYRNRWRFPKNKVQQRWLGAGATALRSDWDGAVTFHITDVPRLHARHRPESRRYWHRR